MQLVIYKHHTLARTHARTHARRMLASSLSLATFVLRVCYMRLMCMTKFQAERKEMSLKISSIYGGNLYQ